MATNRLSLAEQPLKTVWQVTKIESAFALAKRGSRSRRPTEGAILEPMTGDPRTSAVANVRLAAIDIKAASRGGMPPSGRRSSEKDQTNLQSASPEIGPACRRTDGRGIRERQRAAAERHPASASPLFRSAGAQMARRQPAAAIAAYREVLRLNPRATAARLRSGGWNSCKDGRMPRWRWLEALAAEPGNGDATFSRAWSS